MDAALLDRAACRGHDPNLWFPGPQDLDNAVKARLICATCPIVPECIVAAGDSEGIRGGLSLAERDEHVVPVVALEQAKVRAGWKRCPECTTLFKPTRSNHMICTTNCRERRRMRAKYQSDPEWAEKKRAYRRSYYKAAEAVEKAEARRRYWASVEENRERRRRYYREHQEIEKERRREYRRRQKDIPAPPEPCHTPPVP